MTAILRLRDSYNPPSAARKQNAATGTDLDATATFRSCAEGQIRSLYDEQAEYWRKLYEADEAELTIYATHFRQRRAVLLGMIDELTPGSEAQALDVGCGPGAYIQPLLDRGYRVSALDASPKMVAQAGNNFDSAARDRVDTRVGNAERLPYASEAFDLVLSVAVLHYMPKDVDALAEIYRVLKPGGTLIVVVDNKKDLSDRIDVPLRARRLVRRLTGKRRSVPADSKGTRVPTDESGLLRRTYSPAEIRRLLRNAGLLVDEETTIGFAPFRFNGKRFLCDKADKWLDKRLQFFRKLPFLRMGGYMYICRCHKPA